MKYKVLVFLGFSLLILYSCSSIKNKKREKELAADTLQLDFKSGPPTIVYKTSEDYTEYVPVTLSEDKSKITSFPHPKDLFLNGELALPTKLSDGFLLDNRGIDTNVAFLSIKYNAYSKLKSAPNPDSLLTLILDDEPLQAFYNCGSKYIFKDIVTELNGMIESSRLQGCKCLVSDAK